MTRFRGLVAMAVLAFPGCSAADGPARPFGATGGVTGLGGVPSTGGMTLPAGSGGVPVIGNGGGGAAPGFTVRIRHQETDVTSFPLPCGGGCADVTAVASGGKEPYSFVWEDGSTSAERRLCPGASTTYEVIATDAGVTGGEFRRDPLQARATVRAELQRCIPDGGPPPAQKLCLSNPSFEGTAVITEFGGFTAPPWSICDPPGSPDIRSATQGWSVPGPEPAEGASYLNLLWWRELWIETVAEPLCEPMMAGKTYSFEVDVAWQGWIEGVTNGQVEFWASHALCGEDQLLWKSPVADSAWKRHCVTFTAEEAYGFIQLRPATLRTGVIVDNIVPVEKCGP